MSIHRAKLLACRGSSPQVSTVFYTQVGIHRAGLVNVKRFLLLGKYSVQYTGKYSQGWAVGVQRF